jgi:hypothetical protein
MNVGDAVYYFQIKLDFLKDTVFTEEAKFTAIGVNEQKFVINDNSFTRVQHKDEKFFIDTPFKVAKVSRWNTKPYWDELRGYIYTDNKSRAIAHRAIKKALEEYLYENYGRYCKGIELLKGIEE